jgi:uncharacterized protein (TIGR00369 family)
MASGEKSQKTHLFISEELVGKAEEVDSGRSSRVSLTVGQRMRVDEKGLIHGGFTFGLADYAAMVAVNDPFVVLLSSQVRFLKPVVVGDRITAHAGVMEINGQRRKVRCEVFNQAGIKVLEGEFLCLTLERHVLERGNLPSQRGKK